MNNAIMNDGKPKNLNPKTKQLQICIYYCQTKPKMKQSGNENESSIFCSNRIHRYDGV